MRKFNFDNLSLLSDEITLSDRVRIEAFQAPSIEFPFFAPQPGPLFATINGTSGDDVLIGTAGNDSLRGFEGDDILIGGAGSDQLNGGVGFDIADYSSAPSLIAVNLLTGGTIGDANGDSFFGIEGVIGSDFNDTLEGNNSANVIMGGLGDDAINGGTGNDTAVYAAENITDYVFTETAAGVYAVQGPGGLGEGTDTLTSIETIRLGGIDGVDYDISYFTSSTGVNLTEGDDVYNANAGDVVFAGGGNDYLRHYSSESSVALFGQAGDDDIRTTGSNRLLDGGAGNDIITLSGGENIRAYGGEGNDMITFYPNSYGSDAILDGGSGIDTLIFHTAGITPWDYQGDANVHGGTLNLMTGETGGAYQGAAISNFERLDFFGGGQTDYITGGDFDDIIHDGGPTYIFIYWNQYDNYYEDGIDWNDTLIGGGGNDQLISTGGGDILFGGAGDDILSSQYSPYSDIETAVYESENAADYLIALQMERGGQNDRYDVYTVEAVGGTGEGIDTLTGITTLRLGGMDGVNYNIANLLTGAVNLTSEGDDYTGTTLNDIVNGFNGNDILRGLDGDDILNGGFGDDIFEGGSGADRMDGGNGADTVSYINAASGVILNLYTNETSGAAAGDIFYSIEHVIGSSFDDDIAGNYSRNTLRGEDGDDQLNGFHGNDLLEGGAGSDTLIGGSGQDVAIYSSASLSDYIVIEVAPGDYTVEAVGGTGEGIDTLTGIETIRLGGIDGVDYNIGDLTNSINLTNGDDTYTASTDEVVNGLDGNDTLTASGSNIMLNGDDGDDILFDILAGNALNILNGGAGTDTFHLEGSGSTANGGLGGDTIFITNEGSFANGDAGNDTISATFVFGTSSSMTLNGGDGTDMLVFRFDEANIDDDEFYNYINSFGGTLDLSTGTSGGDYATLNLSGFERLDFIGGGRSDNVVGGAGDDIIQDGGTYSFIGDIGWFGNGNNDTIYGMGGDDIIIGTGGIDILDGGDGNDTITSGANIETAYEDYINQDFQYGLRASRAVMNGGAGDDIINSYGDDTLEGGAGDDTLINHEDDAVAVYSSADAAEYVITEISAGVYTVEAIGGTGEGTDTLTGIEIIRLGGTDGTDYDIATLAIGGDINLTNGDDDYTGTSADETINGLDGNDIIRGAGGDDTLNGDAGNDILTDSEGDNTLNGGSGDDTFLDTNYNENIFNGGDGRDTVSYAGLTSFDLLSGAMQLNIDLITGTSSGLAIYDSFISVENIIGSNSRNVLRGDNGANELTGGEANDYLSGRSGDDTFIGLEGDDELTGGFGMDTAVYNSSNVADYLVTETAPGEYTIEAIGGTGEGTDTLTGVETIRLGGQNGTDYDISTLAVSGDTNLTNGDDIYSGTSADEVINGLDGNDIIDGGAGNNTLNGDAGNDTLISLGNDSLNGGTGDDLVELGGNVFDAATATDGGADIDTISFSTLAQLPSGNLFLVIDLQGQAYSVRDGSTVLYVDQFTSFENAIGSEHRDLLQGDSAANTLSGLSGNDTLQGRGGDDILNGGSGDNTLQGGDGQDQIFSLGNDIIDAGEGNDFVEIGESVMDSATAIAGGSGIDTLSLTRYVGNTAAINFIVVDLQSQAFSIREDGAIIHVEQISGFENATGTDYTDLLQGDGASNGLSGLGGDDTLQGRGGDDILLGGDGNDLLDGGDGNDILDGGAGTDIASYDTSTSAIVFDGLGLVTASGDIADDTLLSIEAIRGTDFNDRFFGANDTSIFYGGAGADRLFGRNGDDQLLGEAGDDIILGGRDNDFIDGGADNDQLRGNEGDDTLLGGEGNDVLAGGAGADAMDGGAGIDRVEYTYGTNAGVTASLGDASINTGDAAGDTYINIENLYGTTFNDALYGDAGNNRIDGRLGDDMLFGGDGNDYLIGGAGEDILNGEAGNDLLLGQAGADIYQFDAAHGTDRIVVFTQGEDLIEFTEGVFDFSGLTITQDGAHVNIVSSEGTIIANNSLVADFTADDFIFAPPPAQDPSDLPLDIMEQDMAVFAEIDVLI